MGVTPFIVGFEVDKKDGKGHRYNIILSNGDRSAQRDKDHDYYDQIMPEGTPKKIMFVAIYVFNDEFIVGFEFFDKDYSLIWRIGDPTNGHNLHVKTVELAENEVIVGVLAKLCGWHKSIYTAWQFRIGRV